MVTTKEILQSALSESWYANTNARREDSLRLAKRLLKSGLQSASGRRLVTGLRRCHRRHRCGSSACPQCSTAEQALLVSMTVEFAASHAEGLEIAFATIIPPKSSVAMGALCQFDLANFQRRIRDGLAKTQALWAVGALDVTLNEHRDGLFESHWSPHAHIIVAIDDIDKFAHELRAPFPRSTQAPRPIVVKKWDDDPRVFSYIFGVDFDRRISIEGSKRFDPGTGTTRWCRATAYGRLRVSERIELAMFLETIGLGGRLLLRNVRLYSAGKSARLQLINS